MGEFEKLLYVVSIYDLYWRDYEDQIKEIWTQNLNVTEGDSWDDDTYGTFYHQCIKFRVAKVRLLREAFAHCAV